MAAIYLKQPCQFNNKKNNFLKLFQDALKNNSLKNNSKKFSLFANLKNSKIHENNHVEKNHIVKTTLSNGIDLTIESGKLAKLADGSAVVSLQGTSVMATAVCKNKNSNVSFLPLTVSYQQKAAALGRIPLNFLRREHGQNETEILSSRIIDRSIRPLFPKNFYYDTQVFCNPLCMDGNNFPDILSINAASAALALSDIPWNGPIGAVRLGLINDTIIINPTKKELNESSINLVISCKEKKYVVMLDGSFSQTSLNDIKKVIKVGVKECQNILQAINKLCNQCGKKKRVFKDESISQEIYDRIKLLSEKHLISILSNYSLDKISRDEAISSVLYLVIEKMKEVDFVLINKVFTNVLKDIFRNLIFDQNIRCDGRSLSMLRHINCEVDLYKSLHGSALFQRGQTQVFCTVALDSPSSALKMDNISMLTSGVKEKNFFVHYEFPPYATNDLGRIGPIGRREIGHGILAEKALKSIIPSNFPFTIRLTSEVLESNGSSSMATVCGGSLALMDAGVPISNPCAGVAIGIITKFFKSDPSELENYRILTDLLGIEDYFGDMDFKVAGTKKAITAIQMDVKIPGLPLKVIAEVLDQAKSAISEVLNKMHLVCPGPRTSKKENWPVIKKVSIPIDLRSKFMGPAKINIKKLEMSTGAQIVEEVLGEYNVFAANAEALKEVEEKILEFIENHKHPNLEFGGVYTATITEIRDNGCMVIFYPNMDAALLPLSQLDIRKVAHPSALGLNVGDEIQVKYFGRDPVSGFMRLSRKVIQAPKSEVSQSFFPKKTEVDNVEKQEAEKQELVNSID